jgi:nucleoside-diphosphate kinase
MERTFAILKPDCVQQKHCPEVVQMLLANGFKVVAAKAERLSEAVLTEHYAHHASKPFFPSLVSYMRRTPVLLLILERENAVSELRKLCGPTDSNEARKVAPASIRAKFGKDKSENVIHASDAIETAQEEQKRFFSPAELSKLSAKGLTSAELDKIIAKLYG